MEGALVYLEYSYWPKEDHRTKTVEGITDVDGVVRVSLGYKDMDRYDAEVLIVGNVTAGADVQRVRFEMDFEDMERKTEWKPYAHGVTLQGTDWHYDFGKEETLITLVYVDGKLLRSSWAHCYVATESQVLAYKNVTLGSDGLIRIKFQTPEAGSNKREDGHLFLTLPGGQNSPYINNQRDPTIGEEAQDPWEGRSIWEFLDLYSTEDLVITTELTGRRLDITLEHPEAWRGMDAEVNLGYDYYHSGKYHVPEWTYWSVGYTSWSSTYYGGGTYEDHCRFENGTWRTSIVIPEGVPLDGFFLWASLSDPYDWDNEERVTNHAGVVTYENEDDRSSWRIIAGLVLVVETAVVYVIISRSWGVTQRQD